MSQSSRPPYVGIWTPGIAEHRGLFFSAWRTPRIQLGLGPPPILTTSVHEDDFTSARENNGGVSRQAPVVQPVTTAHPVHEAPEQHLRLRVLRPDPAPSDRKS